MFKSKAFDILLIIGLFILSRPLHAQWVEMNGDLPEFSAAEDTVAAQIAVVITDVGMFLTTNGGYHWRKLSDLPGEKYNGGNIVMIDSLHIWTNGRNGEIYGSTDMGQNWVRQFKAEWLTTFVNSIEMFDLNNGVAMADGIGGFESAVVILKTEDGGRHWVSMSDSLFGGIAYNGGREADFLSSGVGYFSPFVVDDCVWKTTDFGENWTKTTYTTPSTPTVLKFYNENIGFVSDGGIARTMDGGNTWKYGDHYNYNGSPSPGTWSAIEFAPGDPSTVWMLGDNEVFFSSDTGNTWNSAKINGYGMSLFNQGVDMVFTDRNNGWLLSQKKIYKTTNGGGFTDVAQVDSRQPMTFLFQNFPNPFNPETEIQFQLRKASPVTLKIHDILGNEINTLLDDRMEAGTHSVHWNARNREDIPVSSGIYIYQLIVDQEVLQGKMTLIR